MTKRSFIAEIVHCTECSYEDASTIESHLQKLFEKRLGMVKCSEFYYQAQRIYSDILFLRSDFPYMQKLTNN